MNLTHLRYDITSISFCGAYDEAALVRYGYSRDHRPDRKQIEVAATVTAAGAHQPLHQTTTQWPEPNGAPDHRACSIRRQRGSRSTGDVGQN